MVDFEYEYRKLEYEYRVHFSQLNAECLFNAECLTGKKAVNV